MFFGKIQTEPIPERIFALTRVVAERSSVTRADCQDIFCNNPAYITAVCTAAEELGLIRKEGEQIVFIGDVAKIQTMEQFRTYCNSVVFRDPTQDFYKLVKLCLDVDDRWIGRGNFTRDPNILSEVYQQTGISNQTLSQTAMPAMRFWLNFLGFGYYNETKKCFLPNMYLALKDFIRLGDFTCEERYSVGSFLDRLHPGKSVAASNDGKNYKLNLAMSNALRLLHDNQEILLENRSDSEVEWSLFYNEGHPFSDKITHITLRKEALA